jgi:hypothetical protein
VAPLTCDFGYDPTGKGEQEARTLHQKHGLDVLLARILQLENASIDELYDEYDRILSLRLGGQPQVDTEYPVLGGAWVDADIDSEFDFRRRSRL